MANAPSCPGALVVKAEQEKCDNLRDVNALTARWSLHIGADGRRAPSLDQNVRVQSVSYS